MEETFNPLDEDSFINDSDNSFCNDIVRGLDSFNIYNGPMYEKPKTWNWDEDMSVEHKNVVKNYIKGKSKNKTLLKMIKKITRHITKQAKKSDEKRNEKKN